MDPACHECARSRPHGDVFAKRYGEVLLVHATESGPDATVYNTAENGAAATLLNGPATG
jgi:hypothetical protein